MRLPGEEELQEHIRAKLANELEFASDLLVLSMGIFSPSTRAKPPEPMEYFELFLCLGIIAKACRQYRGILALAEISLGDVAESNGRMLLETMLAANFLMQSTVTLKREGKPVPEVPGLPLTPAFRTKLYLAYDATSTLKLLRGMAENGDIDKQEAASAIAIAQTHEKENHREIGPEWVKRQKGSDSYSGVRLRDLADSFGKAFIYHTFYRPACAGVHGADARKFADVGENADGNLMFSTVSSPKGVAEALVLSSMAMLDVLDVANKRLGLDIGERLRDLAQRGRLMTHRLPGE
jgi:hypothetical protein